MSNRCPNCEKFVSFEQGEPEVGDLEIDDTGNITGDVRLVLLCAECGEEMKEATIEVDFTPDELEGHIEAHLAAGADYTLEIDADGAEATDRMQTTDRHGKPITNYRYMKRYYGFEMTATVTCSCGADDWSITISGEEQANAFDELV